MRLAFVAGFLLVTACGEDHIRAERLPHRPVVDLVRGDDAAARAIAIQIEPSVPPAPKHTSKFASKAGGGECSPGQSKACFPPHLRPNPRSVGPTMVCARDSDGVGRWMRDNCATPLVVAFDDTPVRFTRPEADFALGESSRTEWVGAETPWLARDADGSGCIESERELFAGFAKLAVLDTNGDGVLDRRDPAFAQLVLWSDRDQDKRCTADEISPLTLDAIPLDAVRMTWTGLSVEGEIAPLPGRRGRIADVYLAPL